MFLGPDLEALQEVLEHAAGDDAVACAADVREDDVDGRLQQVRDGGPVQRVDEGDDDEGLAVGDAPELPVG